MYFIVRLALPLKIKIGGKINPSAAAVRTTVTCLFSEPEVGIVTDFQHVDTNDLSGTMSKNTGVSPMLPIKRNGYFRIWRNFPHSK